MQGRDVFNEKPPEEELVAPADAAPAVQLPAAATLHTDRGDITLQLHGEKVPRTVENFATHARRGYFDGVLFHRVIKNFMIQTGAHGACVCCAVRWRVWRCANACRVLHGCPWLLAVAAFCAAVRALLH